jgi:hypothetical protein
MTLGVDVDESAKLAGCRFVLEKCRLSHQDENASPKVAADHIAAKNRYMAIPLDMAVVMSD